MPVIAEAVKGRRAEHAEDTREGLLAAARELFDNRGYAGTSIDDIARSARVTRGALYHHFASKQDLFRAVVERLYEDVVQRLARTSESWQRPAGAPDRDLWDVICAAYQARLDLTYSDPDFQQIVDQDASSVLGHKTLTEIAQGSANTGLRPALEEAMAAGLIKPVPVQALASLIGALISAAGRAVAIADDKASARAGLGDALDALLQGLRVSTGRA